MILQGLSWFQRLRLPASTTGSMEFVPGWGTRIPYSLWCDQKKEKNGLKKKKTSTISSVGKEAEPLECTDLAGENTRG